MGRATYYSPMLLGLLLVLGLNEPIRNSLQYSSDRIEWTIVVGLGLGVGVLAQFLMLGFQGVAAQVLPAPGGRSIRGSAARGAGYLIILGVLMGGAAGLLVNEDVRTAGWIVAGAAGASLLGAVCVYAWAWPTAVRDFADEL